MTEAIETPVQGIKLMETPTLTEEVALISPPPPQESEEHPVDARSAGLPTMEAQGLSQNPSPPCGTVPLRGTLRERSACCPAPTSKRKFTLYLELKQLTY